MAESGAGDAVRAGPGRLREPAGCLGADLATGRRTESAHLASVAVLLPADCGDLRNTITAMASLPYTSHAIEADLLPTESATDPLKAARIGLAAAALFSLPDQKPRVTLEEGLDGGRGRERHFLEESAAARWLAPEYRAIRTWDTASGYEAVESSRANLAHALSRQPSLGGGVGVE